MKKSRIIASLMILAVFAALRIIPALAVESSVSPNETYSGTITEDTVKLYRLTLPQSGKLTISVNSEVDHYLNFYYYDPTTETTEEFYGYKGLGYIGIDDVTRKAVATDSEYLFAGEYLVRVEYAGETGKYSFTTSFEPVNESFPETRTKRDDYKSSANKMDFNKTYNGMIARDYDGDQDCFCFTKTKKGQISLEVYGYYDGGWQDVSIYSGTADPNSNDENGRIGYDVETKDDALGAWVTSKKYTLNPGTYYVMIKVQYTGKYTIKVEDKNESAGVPSYAPSSKPGTPTPTSTGRSSVMPSITPTISPSPTITPTITPTPIPTITPTSTPTVKPTSTPYTKYIPSFYISNNNHGRDYYIYTSGDTWVKIKPKNKLARSSNVKKIKNGVLAKIKFKKHRKHGKYRFLLISCADSDYYRKTRYLNLWK